MTGGGSKPQTQTTTSVLSPEQQELMGLAMPGVRQFAANVPKRYDGSAVADFNANQVAGQGKALTAADTQAGIVGSGANTSNFWNSGNVWDPASNPALSGAIDAATRPITQNYQENVLPGIGHEADKTGNFGSSRQGVAEGVAARGYMNAVGDTSSKLVQNQYETNVNAQLKALGLLPQTAGAATMPATTTSGVGDVQQALEQARLSESVAGFNYDQMAPFLQSKELMSLLQGMPGGSTVSEASTPQTNKLTSSLGGAMSGAAAGSMFGPPGMVVGGGLGALLPFLS